MVLQVRMLHVLHVSFDEQEFHTILKKIVIIISWKCWLDNRQFEESRLFPIKVTPIGKEIQTHEKLVAISESSFF